MTGKLYCYYRISDAGNPLGRTELGDTFLSTLDRKKCFVNFLDAFGVENLKIFADNVKTETVDFIKNKNVEDIIVTKLGNTLGFVYLIQSAIQNLEDEDILYIVEDDYLHTQDARQYIFEGIELGDYVSLYDSLDKYQGTNNPLISGGGENTKVILGKTSHFKYTNATTGTFASKIKTL
jgi:glycosyltransferase involved in cell wall biosynthesis